MTQFDKLVKKICARPPSARFSDVHAVLAAMGWRHARTKGSHFTYVKDGEPAIVVPKDGGQNVKRAYLDEICERLRLEDGE